MRAGMYTERIRILTPTSAKDALGGDVDTFVSGASIPAGLTPLRSDEIFRAQAMGQQTDYRFTVRARTDLTKSTRLTWTPRWPSSAAAVTLEVHGVSQGRTREDLVLDCGVVL